MQGAKDHQGFLVGQLFREITLDFSTDFLPVMKERLESRDRVFSRPSFAPSVHFGSGRRDRGSVP